MKRFSLVALALAMCILTACNSGSRLSSESEPPVQERAEREIVAVRPELTASETLELPTTEAEDMKIQMETNYKTYRARNNDVSGLLRVVGLGIDEPVVSVSDNMEYLRINVDKEDAFTGVLFFDERIQGDVSSVPNIVVYGHNIGDGGDDMFAPLLKMTDQKIFDSVSMMLYQNETLYIYKPIAAYVTDVNNPYNEPYPAEVKDVLAKRTESPTASLEIKEDSKLLTLSTCTNRVSDERFTVQAVLVAKH